MLSAAAQAQIRRAKTDSWVDAQAGLVVFAGDALKAGDRPLSFALCPELSAQTVSVNQTFIVPVRPASACDLPETVAPDAISTRGGEACGNEAVDLTGELHSAAQAARNRDYKAASETYRKISCGYPAAGWARGVISYLSTQEADSVQNSAPGETYALLIGISRYADKTPQGSLQYAAADAVAFEKFLEQRRGGSVPEKNILLLIDAAATRAAIDNAIDTFVHDARKKENTLIVFIAGHGDYLITRKDADGTEVHEDPFFVTYDSYVQDVKTTGFPMAKIRDFIVGQSEGFRRVIAYVDICHAGYTAPERDLPAAVKKVFDANKASLGVLMATAPQANAFAYESPTFGGGHGAFTYAVLSDLITGKPMPGHKELSLAGLYAGAAPDVIRLTNGAQIPAIFSPNPQMSVLDDATVPSDFTLGDATPLSESSTRRRRGKGDADQASDVPDASPPPGAPQLRVALEDKGQQILVRYLRGEQAAMVKNDFDLCAASFRAALAIVPLSVFDESRALFCEGRAAIFDKTPQGYQRAAQLLDQSVSLDPEHGYAYNALGIAYLEQGDYDRAIAAFGDAIRFAPRWAYPLHNLALAYSERGDFPAARRTYLQAMELAQYYSYLPYNLGLLNQNVNRFDDAEKYYRKAIATADEARRLKIEPATLPYRERAVAWNALATVEIARRRYSKALEDLKNALGDDETLTAAKHNRALLLSRTSVSPEAERLWREIIASDATAVDSRLELARYLDKTGRPDEALVMAPANVEGDRLMGAILMHENKPGEALPHLDAVRSRLPGDGAAQEAWADAAAVLKVSGAADAYRAALRVYTDRRDKSRVSKKLAAMNH